MYLAWTTVAQRPAAERLAGDAVALGLAVCVQIEGPIVSHYRWEGQAERTEEYRLMFKCLPVQLAPLEAWVLAHHPYAVPEWIALPVARVGEKYLSWAAANSTNPPL